VILLILASVEGFCLRARLGVETFWLHLLIGDGTHADWALDARYYLRICDGLGHRPSLTRGWAVRVSDQPIRDVHLTSFLLKHRSGTFLRLWCFALAKHALAWYISNENSFRFWGIFLLRLHQILNIFLNNYVLRFVVLVGSVLSHRIILDPTLRQIACVLSHRI
jgi:hypothetical protein